MKTLDRFRQLFRKPDDMDSVFDAAHTIFNTPSGHIVESHLVEHAKLDDPVGSIPLEQVQYMNGYQDAIKYVLTLANEITTRSDK